MIKMNVVEQSKFLYQKLQVIHSYVTNKPEQSLFIYFTCWLVISDFILSPIIFDTVFCTILAWHNFGVLSADISLKIIWKYPQILSIEDRGKHCLKSKLNLGYYLLTPIYVRLSLKEENEIISTPNKWYVLQSKYPVLH